MALAVALPATAKDKTIASPNGQLIVKLSDADGKPTYTVTLNGKEVLCPSRLGFIADFGDLTHGMTLSDSRDYPMEKHYDMTRTKRAHVDFKANATDVTFANAEGQHFVVTFVVDDNNIALRYAIPRQKDDNPKCAVIRSEATSFRFPDGTTTFLCPQITPMSGWERTKPSYEEEYTADAPMAAKSQFGVGYTFPCLFHEQLPGNGKAKKAGQSKTNYWVLVSETGIDGSYCGSRLSDYDPQTGYTVAYPQPGENNGNGSGPNTTTSRDAIPGAGSYGRTTRSTMPTRYSLSTSPQSMVMSMCWWTTGGTRTSGARVSRSLPPTPKRKVSASCCGTTAMATGATRHRPLAAS